MSISAEERFKMQLEIMAVLKRHYPSCMSGTDAHDAAGGMRELSMVTGVLLAAVYTQKNEATFKYVLTAYLRGLAENIQGISAHAANILRGMTKDAHNG